MEQGDVPNNLPSGKKTVDINISIIGESQVTYQDIYDAVSKHLGSSYMWVLKIKVIVCWICMLMFKKLNKFFDFSLSVYAKIMLNTLSETLQNWIFQMALQLFQQELYFKPINQVCNGIMNSISYKFSLIKAVSCPSQRNRKPLFIAYLIVVPMSTT